MFKVRKWQERNIVPSLTVITLQKVIIIIAVQVYESLKTKCFGAKMREFNTIRAEVKLRFIGNLSFT
jgi:hypothetical protein